MAIEVKEVYEDWTIQYTPFGINATTKYNVNGMSPTGLSATKLAKVVPGLPRLFRPHPFEPSATCQSLDIRPRGATNWDLIANYASPGGGGGGESGTEPLIETGSNLISDIALVYLGYNGNAEDRETQAGYSLPPANRRTHSTNAEVPVQRPLHGIRITLFNQLDPSEQSMNYTGTTNASPWRGKATNTWLMTGINGTSDDGGKSYRKTIEMIHHPGGFLQYAAIRINGEVPGKATTLSELVKQGKAKKPVELWPPNLDDPKDGNGKGNGSAICRIYEPKDWRDIDEIKQFSVASKVKNAGVRR